MIIDTHCHLEDDYFEKNRKDIIDNLTKNNIESAFVVGTDYQSCIDVLKLAGENKNIFAIIGLYPEYANDYTEEFENLLRNNLNNKKVVAVGEIGLDYHNVNYNKQQQIEVFEKQIKLANEFGLPVSIHSRESFEDTISVLEKNEYLLKNGGVIHCFSGSPEIAKRFVKLGFKLGFGGVCTFKNARKVVETIKQIDAKDILLETDAPYLSPEPFRGQLNEPKRTNIVLEKIAELKNLDVKFLEEQIYLNTLEVFKRYKNNTEI